LRAGEGRDEEHGGSEGGAATHRGLGHGRGSEYPTAPADPASFLPIGADVNPKRRANVA
jgi:hypothetical protein